MLHVNPSRLPQSHIQQVLRERSLHPAWTQLLCLHSQVSGTSHPWPPSRGWLPCPATQETQVLQVNSYPLQVDFTDSRNPSFPKGGSLHKGKG